MARKPPPTSLTGRLLLWVTLITAAAMIGVVGAATIVARSVLEAQILRDAEEFARDVAFDVEANVDPVELLQDQVWSNKLLRRLSLRNGLRGIIIEVEAGGRTSRLQASSTQALDAELIAIAEVELGGSLSRSGESHIEVLLRQELEDGELFLRVFASTSVIQAFQHVVYRNAAIFGLVTWGILVLTIAFLINRTVTRPLRRVSEAMGEVAEGRLSQSLDVVVASEVEPLVKTFNRMSSRLFDTERERTSLLEEVEGLNNDLKVRVEEATFALAVAQAELAKGERLAALGELVGTIAHEVGTPLNSVLAHLDLLEADLPAGANRQRLDLVVREIERVSDVIRRYLRSTRAPNPQRNLTDVDFVIHEALRIFESQAVSEHVVFAVHSDVGRIGTDPQLLIQIVRNLVANALAAVAGEDTVEIVAKLAESSHLEITVSDTGIGMDPETQELVFEPFYSARRGGGGTGLGMSIVRKAVTSLGGSITIDSSPGEGTSIMVEIPVEQCRSLSGDRQV